MIEEEGMTLIEHVEELRRRLIISVAAILITTTGVFFVADFLLQILLLPSGGLKLNAFSITDGFMIKAQIALFGGIVLAFPVWAFQILRFVVPGLTDEERRTLLPALGFALALFILGICFGYAMLSGMIHALLQFFPTGVDLLPAANDYISFILFFLLAAGTAFQLPTVVIVLVQLRILNTGFLRKQRRAAYFILFAFAEIITPVADPIVAPMIVMVPLILLFELSIFLARRIENRRRQQEALEEAALANAIVPAGR